MRFDGSDYKPVRDDNRLTSQLLRIWEVVRHGGWWTLNQIATRTGEPAPSVSAQLRHLRKERFGSHQVDKRYTSDGLYEYRVTPNHVALVR